MSNEFKVFASAAPGTANSLSPSAYAALTALLANGFQPGIALSEQVNTTLRQCSTVAAGVGTFIDDNSASNAVDNGSASDLALALKAAVEALIGWRTGDVKATTDGNISNHPGWIKANGAAVSRTGATAGLFALYGVTYGVGDGSTTFQLPDLRAEFLRGWDDGRGVDSSRGLNTSQADQLKTHTHEIAASLGGSATIADQIGVFNTAQGDELLSSAYILPPTTGAGAETRPRNFSVLYLIRL